MEKIISSPNLRNFSYVNDTICKMTIKGIVISFFGLDGMPQKASFMLKKVFYNRTVFLVYGLKFIAKSLRRMV